MHSNASLPFYKGAYSFNSCLCWGDWISTSRLSLAAGLCCKRLMGAQHQALHWQQEPAAEQEQVLQRVSPAVLTSLFGAVISLFCFVLLWENDVQVADSSVI